MIDFHCHILPGVDDGPYDLTESIQMAEIASQDGIEAIVATPHFLEFRPEAIQANLAYVAKTLDGLNLALRKEGISLAVKSGFEVALTEELPELVANYPALTIEGLNKYILVELPSSQFPLYTEQVLFQLQSQGICPIIAHPERNWALLEKPSLLEAMVERGILAQATASSFLGSSGKEAKRALEDWCKKGYIHIVGSDAHSSEGRTPILSPARKVLKKWVGTQHAEWICQVPSLVLEGKEVEANLWVDAR